MHISVTKTDRETIIQEKMAAYEARLRHRIPLGDFVNHFLRKRFANHHVLNAVKREYPKSNASMNTISAYRKQLRKTEPDIPKSTQAK